jgi:hypothetical protein
VSAFTRFSAELSIVYAKEESDILGRDIWRVKEGFRYYVGEENSNTWVDIPRGYLIDGASVPRMLWSIIPPWGAYGAATAVHDKLCEYLSFTVDGLPVKITREQADDILAEAMEVLDVNKRDQDLINLAVSAYRKIKRIQSPVWHKDKAALEANWAANNPM